MAYILTLLDREESRSQHLSNRSAVVGSSAVGSAAILLAALSFAGDNDVALTSGDKDWVRAALISLGVAAVASLVGLIPKPMGLPNLDDLSTYLDEPNFDREPRFASRPLALSAMDDLRSIAARNTLDAVVLLIAFIAQTAGFVSLAVVILRIT